MAAKETVNPTCRYGHGPLLPVTQRGTIREWGIRAHGASLHFGLALYICPTCGYAELFDPDTDKTVAVEKGQ